MLQAQMVWHTEDITQRVVLEGEARGPRVEATRREERLVLRLLDLAPRRVGRVAADRAGRAVAEDGA